MIYALGSAHESSASESKQSRSKVKILAARDGREKQLIRSKLNGRS